MTAAFDHQAQPRPLPVRAAAQALRPARWLLDALLPPRCIGCGQRSERVGDCCPVCWEGLRFLSGRVCDACGRPLSRGPAADLSAAPPSRCDGCALEGPLYGRARAALAYEGLARSMVLRFKHGDRLEGLRGFGAWMAAAGAPLLREADWLVPVPVHRWKLVKRGYNQSALLAQAVARAGSGAVRGAASQSGSWPRPAVDMLVKTKATASQQGLSAAERRANIRANAFKLHPRWRDRAQGAKVVLVDDVLTTGSTVEACAGALLAGGVERVDVLTLARVVGEHGGAGGQAGTDGRAGAGAEGAYMPGAAEARPAAG